MTSVPSFIGKGSITARKPWSGAGRPILTGCSTEACIRKTDRMAGRNSCSDNSFETGKAHHSGISLSAEQQKHTAFQINCKQLKNRKSAKSETQNVRIISGYRVFTA